VGEGRGCVELPRFIKRSSVRECRLVEVLEEGITMIYYEVERGR
jgi:hypothetical protein